MRFNFAILAVNLLIVSTIVCAEASIITVKSEKEFDQLLQKASQPVAVQFHSGCSVCNSTRKHLKVIALDYSSILFVEVNITTIPELAQRYSIVALPTVLIFEPANTKPKYTIVGPDKASLTSKINDLLKSKQ